MFNLCKFFRHAKCEEPEPIKVPEDKTLYNVWLKLKNPKNHHKTYSDMKTGVKIYEYVEYLYCRITRSHDSQYNYEGNYYADTFTLYTFPKTKFTYSPSKGSYCESPIKLRYDDYEEVMDAKLRIKLNCLADRNAKDKLKAKQKKEKEAKKFNDMTTNVTLAQKC